MARYTAGGLTGAGSTTLPISSLYSTAAMRIRVREIYVFNTATTAVALRLVRLSTTGTRGAAFATGSLYAEDPTAALGVAYNTHTGGPTMTDLGFRTVLGAAAGSGMIWSFEDYVMTIGATANAGIGIVVDNGTGQACQVSWSWTE
jgi:hypothetical protein